MEWWFWPFERYAEPVFGLMQRSAVDTIAGELGLRTRVTFDPARPVPQADVIEAYDCLLALPTTEIIGALGRISAALRGGAWLNLPSRPDATWLSVFADVGLAVHFYSITKGGCVAFVRRPE